MKHTRLINADYQFEQHLSDAVNAMNAYVQSYQTAQEQQQAIEDLKTFVNRLQPTVS